MENKDESRILNIKPGGSVFTDEFVKENTEGYQWLMLFQPDEEQLLRIAEPVGIHPLSVEDCMEDDQIPKMEIYDSVSHLLINTFRYERGVLKSGELNIFIADNFVISVTRSRHTQQKLLLLADRMQKSAFPGQSKSPSFLVHKIIDMAADEKVEAMDAIEDAIYKTEEDLLAYNGHFDFTALQQLRRDILFVRKSVFHEREVLNRIIRGDCPQIKDKAMVHFRDIYDHLLRLYEMAESFRETIKSLVELNLSMANNQMAQAANATNKTVRRLTFITTIFMPLTLLAGIGGMSEFTMMAGTENWKTSYLLLCVGMAVLGIISYAWLKRFDRGNED